MRAGQGVNTVEPAWLSSFVDSDSPFPPRIALPEQPR